MIRAVIFDMYETLITHYKSPLYFGAHMAKDAEISEDKFFPLWRGLDYDRTIGKLTLEELLERILRENDCYSKALLNELVTKRIATKEECFKHLHTEIIPMLSQLKEQWKWLKKEQKRLFLFVWKHPQKTLKVWQQAKAF